MIRNAIFMIFLLFSGLTSVMAQDKVNPLIERMNTAKGIQKIDLMNELATEYRKTDRLASLHYARKAFGLSDAGNYTAGKALALKNEGICWFFIGNNDSAAICYTRALDFYKQIGDQKGISACYNNLGLIAQETGRYDEALTFYQRSIEMDRKLGDDIGVALTLENMANIHMYLGDAQSALVLTNECLGIYKAKSYKPGLMTSYGNRGAEYDYLAKYDQAIRDFEMALSLAKELNDKYEEAKANGNLGSVYWHMGKPDIAMKYLDLSLENSDETDDAYSIDNVLKTKAQIYTFQQKYIEANQILFKILKRNEEVENERQAAVIMTSIGRNLIGLNEIDKASGYLSKSLEITTRLNAPYEMLNNYRDLVYVNVILHNFAAADSLQDLFAETYSQIASRDTIANSMKKVKRNNPDKTIPVSVSTPSDWIIAFSLIGIIILLSLCAYSQKK